MDYHGRISAFYATLLYLLLQLPTVTPVAISPPSAVIESRQTTPTDPNDSATTSLPSNGQDNSDSDMNSDHVFNYYFLLIAIFIAVLLLAFVCAGKRRKRKSLRLLTTRQEALRRDIESWHGRPRPPINTPHATYASRFTGGPQNWRPRTGNEALGVMRHDEGLDEAGEAPPPYNPGDKPPSLATNDIISSEVTHAGAGLAVPLRTMSRHNGAHPPGYMEVTSSNGSDESDTLITRPDPAVTTDTADGTRRLLERTEDVSSQ